MEIIYSEYYKDAIFLAFYLMPVIMKVVPRIAKMHIKGNFYE